MHLKDLVNALISVLIYVEELKKSCRSHCFFLNTKRNLFNTFVVETNIFCKAWNVILEKVLESIVKLAMQVRE